VDVWAVPVFVVATFALWLFDRPGPVYRWRIACLSALTSAAVGLVISQTISHIWDRPRPSEAHPADTLLLVPASHDPSFPSEHAVASFAIAFSVLFLGSRLAGALFLTGAFAISVSRIFVGLHYPGDVLGGIAVGLVAAAIVFYLGRARWSPVVSLLSRITDPLAALLWRGVDSLNGRRRGRRVKPAA
jgi:undecaprenyl-diphosphatase